MYQYKKPFFLSRFSTIVIPARYIKHETWQVIEVPNKQITKLKKEKKLYNSKPIF